MIEYRTKHGDRLDQICFKHYGRVDVIVKVLDANIGLEEQSPVLPAGLIIKLPEIGQPGEFDKAKESTWG